MGGEKDSEQSKVKVEIPENAEVLDLQKQAYDPHSYLLKNPGEVFWVKIYTAQLRDLIKEHKEYKENAENKYNRGRSSYFYCDVDRLLKHTPVGTNYEWIDYKISARYPTDEFYRSCLSVAKHLRVSDIGPNDYILIGASETPIVTALLNKY
jgi:hypothetical protein